MAISSVAGSRAVPRFAIAQALVAGMCWGAPMAALPLEVQVSPYAIADYEFDWGRNGVDCPTCNDGAGNCRFAFVDTNHNLWLAYVDRNTGGFYPADGRGMLVDHNAATSAEVGNGPEWVMSQDGSQLVYTRWTDGQPDTLANANVGLALVGDGQWSAGPLDHTQGRFLPIGTLNADDPNPAVDYQSPATGNAPGLAYWRALQPDSPETVLPVPPTSRRWVPESHDIIITANAAPNTYGVVYHQAFVVHGQSNALEQLTFDPSDKQLAWMWQPPEYPGEYAFFVLVGGNRLDIYHPVPHGGSVRWVVAKSIAAPSATPYIGSPEPFMHNDKSWIFFTLRANPNIHDETAPTRVAMSGISPEDPIQMLTTTNNPPRVRRDPEYFITANGPYIYYNRLVPATATRGAISEGVFRVDTGLGAPVPRTMLAWRGRP